MAALDSSFSSLLEGYDLAQLDRHDGAIYALCRDWRLRYFNDGWRQFANDNGGEPVLSQAWPLGAAIFEAFSPLPLREFFEFHYRECLREGAQGGGCDVGYPVLLGACRFATLTMRPRDNN